MMTKILIGLLVLTASALSYAGVSVDLSQTPGVQLTETSLVKDQITRMHGAKLTFQRLDTRGAASYSLTLDAAPSWYLIPDTGYIDQNRNRRFFVSFEDGESHSTVTFKILTLRGNPTFNISARLWQAKPPGTWEYYSLPHAAEMARRRAGKSMQPLIEVWKAYPKTYDAAKKYGQAWEQYYAKLSAAPYDEDLTPVLVKRYATYGCLVNAVAATENKPAGLLRQIEGDITRFHVATPDHAFAYAFLDVMLAGRVVGTRDPKVVCSN